MTDLKKIGKICGTAMIAFFLALATWYFLLIDLPEHQVQGTAAPTMTKEEALDLMNYHGVRVIWVEDGEWVFEQEDKICKLIKKNKFPFLLVFPP